jgi:hypothetical protein
MQNDVAKAIATFEDRRKAETRPKVEAFAHDLGYTRTELVGTETKSSRAPAAAKYRRPKNLSLAWFSRGCKGTRMANAPSKQGAPLRFFPESDCRTFEIRERFSDIHAA